MFERAPEFTEAGAGLSLWPNALRALDFLGLGDQVRELAVFEGQSGVQTARGRWLSKTDAGDLIERFGQAMMVHRAGLLGVLLHPIPALLEAADPDAVLRLDIYEVPPLRSYTEGRVVLVGDAAHAMTPDLGQGGCQALEDAVVLGRVLADCGEPDIAGRLAGYDQRRRPRTQMIARQSARIGVMAQWASPVAVALRNAGLRLLPASALARSLAPALKWDG